MSRVRDNLETMLARGQDNALLRFSLGNLCLQADDAAAAVTHLEQATSHDPDYSAAWKLLGKARLQAGDAPGAGDAWRQGIAVAERRGDKQAAREMAVFLRRLDREA
ncbi:MAG: tetratricopeptide repeat protein [Gammaproteobacteria bacterium]|nr:tetratricopeptide repeat protein [Gammaproteobacteria bacterium]TVQ43392.1 MAG: tetratricopeptide repeat protein [Gammaproteobacteria bacterium]